jgi:hypothetical protein
MKADKRRVESKRALVRKRQEPKSAQAASPRKRSSREQGAPERRTRVATFREIVARQWWLAGTD